jgi:hypothetical protein
LVILPLLEYACELWDGCTQQEYNKIEQIQKQELPVAAMFVNGSGQNVQSLERTFAQSSHLNLDWEDLVVTSVSFYPHILGASRLFYLKRMVGRGICCG